MLRKLAPGFVLVVGACGGAESADEGGSDAGAAINYYEDVAPIIANNCFRCHHEGGGGPFVLETYEDVSARGSMIASLTEARIMPPFLADNSGECRTYHDASWLSDADIETIQGWVHDEMPEGDPSKGPEFVIPSDHLADSTHDLTLPVAYMPNIAEDDDDYRCFVIDPGITTEKFLTDYEVVADNPSIVHHVIVYQPSSMEAVTDAVNLDAQEPGAGYTCFGGPIADATVAAAWAPGRYKWSYPAGMGVPIQPATPLIVQMHYHVDDQPLPDQSSVHLKLVDAVEQELLPWFYANTQLAIPGGKDESTQVFELTPETFMEQAGTPHYAAPMTLVGIAPHMHKLGQSERVEVTKSDGSATECLIDVPRWDFNWQYAYFLEQPVQIGTKDVLRMSCTYDSKDIAGTTYWGEGTDEEMCLALMFSTFEGGKIPRQ